MRGRGGGSRRRGRRRSGRGPSPAFWGGKADGEAAASRGVGGGHRARVGFDEAAADGEAEAAAAVVAAARLVAAVGDAAAFVVDVEDGRVPLGGGFDDDGAAGGGVADGVVEEVVEGAAAFAGGDLDRREGVEAFDDGDAFDFGCGAGARDGVGDRV